MPEGSPSPTKLKRVPKAPSSFWRSRSTDRVESFLENAPQLLTISEVTHDEFRLFSLVLASVGMSRDGKDNPTAYRNTSLVMVHPAIEPNLELRKKMEALLIRLIEDLVRALLTRRLLTGLTVL